MGGPYVSGTVTYRERLPLSAGARLIVELRDVSHADAGAIPIASQTIANSGPVPIQFRINYDPDSIDPRGRDSVIARIIEHDGRLAFKNDAAHEVITQGNPKRVAMVLVLVQPPPELVGDANTEWRTWVETPAKIIGAELLPDESENYLRIQYYQSTIEGCARRGSEEFSVVGNDIIPTVTLMQTPDTPWAIPCDEQVAELDKILPLNAEPEAGETYRMIVNDRKVTTIAMPPAHSTPIANPAAPNAGLTVDYTNDYPAPTRLTLDFDGAYTRRRCDSPTKSSKTGAF